MSTTDGAHADEIEGRVVEWVTSALATAETAEGVAVQASARRAPSLPDDGLEVRPEGWTVEVVLRFAEADREKSADVVATIAGATGTVTLENGDAAEIEWPAAGDGPGAEPVEGAPLDKPFGRTVEVAVTIPWPTRNDAAAGSA